MVLTGISVRENVTAVINTMEVMIVLEVIVPCRWPLVALAYASPKTMWLRVESAYIFHHTYPVPEYSMINGNHEDHSSREAPKSENNAVKLTARLFIVHNDKVFSTTVADQMLPCYHCATSCFAAWLHTDESLYSQDFLGLSQWQLGIWRWHACIIIPVNVFVVVVFFIILA